MKHGVSDFSSSAVSPRVADTMVLLCFIASLHRPRQAESPDYSVPSHHWQKFLRNLEGCWFPTHHSLAGGQAPCQWEQSSTTLPVYSQLLQVGTPADWHFGDDVMPAINVAEDTYTGKATENFVPSGRRFLAQCTHSTCTHKKCRANGFEWNTHAAPASIWAVKIVCTKRFQQHLDQKKSMKLLRIHETYPSTCGWHSAEDQASSRSGFLSSFCWTSLQATF